MFRIPQSPPIHTPFPFLVRHIVPENPPQGVRGLDPRRFVTPLLLFRWSWQLVPLFLFQKWEDEGVYSFLEISEKSDFNSESPLLFAAFPSWSGTLSPKTPQGVRGLDPRRFVTYLKKCPPEHKFLLPRMRYNEENYKSADRSLFS